MALAKGVSMFSIVRDSVPGDSLLKTHRGAAHPERWGNYGDCFSVGVDGAVSLADFVFAFYTSPLFRVERLILQILAGAPASDGDALALAQGSAKTFSVWYTGERTATQLLMCDRYERTRSWFQVVPLAGGRTLLQFGSAVAAAPQSATKVSRPGAVFSLLLGFHILYSQLLLSAAKSGVTKIPRRTEK
ncbi:MAG: hypothetical protein ABJC66_05640 [Gammaproteobacteria bacterium]